MLLITRRSRVRVFIENNGAMWGIKTYDDDEGIKPRARNGH